MSAIILLRNSVVMGIVLLPSKLEPLSQPLKRIHPASQQRRYGEAVQSNTNCFSKILSVS